MSILARQSLRFSIEFGLDFQIVKSWWEHMNFADEKEAEAFFEKNKSLIND